MSELPAPRTSRFGPGFDPAALATADECLAAMNELDEERLAIEGQISASSARFHASGERGDPLWFSKAKLALGHRKRLRQRVQERLGTLRRAEKAEHHASTSAAFERRFIQAAKAMLPQETYEALVRAAQNGEAA